MKNHLQLEIDIVVYVKVKQALSADGFYEKETCKLFSISSTFLTFPSSLALVGRETGKAFIITTKLNLCSPNVKWSHFLHKLQLQFSLNKSPHNTISIKYSEYINNNPHMSKPWEIFSYYHRLFNLKCEESLIMDTMIVERIDKEEILGNFFIFLFLVPRH